VFEEGVKVGRIFNLDASATEGRPWMWALGYVPHDDARPCGHPLGGDGGVRQELAARIMNDEQFSAIQGLLTMVILLGLIAGILLALAWEYL
jgi:hypothetical protein